MTYWDVLGIEPTGDTKALKKAYANKLKLHHPEDDMQGFQRLRQAYEWALAQAKFTNGTNSTSTRQQAHEPVCEDHQSEIVKDNVSCEATTDPYNISPDEIVNGFMRKVEDIYNNVLCRNDVNQWKKLLADEALWNIDVTQQLRYRVLTFF